MRTPKSKLKQEELRLWSKEKSSPWLAMKDRGHIAGGMKKERGSYAKGKRAR
jgi:hypothetical protein